MKSSTVRIGKRIMAVMLSLMMVVGIFAGMKLDVKAANDTFDITNKEQIDKVKTIIYQPGDTLTFTKIIIPSNGTFMLEIRMDGYDNGKYVGTRTTEMYRGTGMGRELPCSISFESYFTVLSKTEKYTNPKYQFANILSAEGESPAGGENWRRMTLVFNVFTGETNTPNTPDTPYTPDSSRDVPRSEPAVTPSHECNFQWVTTIDPSAGMDGLEEYKCVYCGAVQESHPIPAGVAAVKDFYGKVKDAPENGTVTYDSGKLYTISDYLLKKLSERSDVTLTVNFEYQNAKYELTFPAGTDFTPVLTDEDTMYGYFGVAAKLGLTVVAK